MTTLFLKEPFAAAFGNNYPNDDKVSSSWEESWTLHEKNSKSLRGKQQQQQQNILLCYPGTYVSILVWLRA